MKKIILLLITIFLLGVYGCTPSATPVPIVQPTAAPKTAVPTAPPTEKPAVPATLSPQKEWDRLVEEAKKEGSIVIYAGPIAEARVALTEAFREKYGISLDIASGKGEEMVTKMDNERRAGIYAVDLSLHGMTTFFNLIKPKKYTVPIKPLLVLPEVLDTSKWRGGQLPLADNDGHLAVLAMASTPHMAINTEMVKPGEITTHTDLLNPKWKGKIAINDPSMSGAGTEWFTFVIKVLMGKEKGTEFMKQLIKQEPVVTRDQRLLSEWVARGKYAIAIAPDKPTTGEFIRLGAPIAFADLKDPRPTSSAAGNLMVFDKIPHPNATKLFVNWLLSKEGGIVFSRSFGHASTRLDVPTDWVDPILVPGPDDKILGEEYQLAKGEMRKLAAEIFRKLTK